VPSGPDDRRWHVSQLEGAFEDEVWTVRHSGVTERIAHGPHSAPPAEPDERSQEVEERLGRDLAAMAEYARASGTPMILLTYPIEASWYAVANRVGRRIAAEYELTLVETVVPVQAIPEAERDWIWVAHPGPRIYAAIATELATVLGEPVVDASGRPVQAPEAGDARPH